MAAAAFPLGAIPAHAEAAAPSHAAASVTAPQMFVEVTGVVEAGTRGNCLIVRSGPLVYELVGSFDRTEFGPGTRATFVGYTVPFMPGFCRQGAPLSVVSATHA